jgi:aspartyl-tRNA(Asn)/glutamyl-tRNA(Gln) amidotransferase subunit A
MDTNFLTIVQAGKLMAEGKLTSRQLTEDCLKTIESQNEKLNALLSVSETALKEADKIDAMRANGEDLPPLAGIPIVTKDNIAVQGWEVTAGSRILEGYHASYDATVVSRLKDAGAILLGRSNMDEFAMGSSGETSHYGPTRNPWDADKVPGGSSSGSCAAVAAGMVSAALGTDTGGSIRQPAALCGVTGLKPTYGRVSRYGLIALASSLDQIGPIARTAEDAAFLLQAIEGSDGKDATTAPGAEIFIPQLAQMDMKGLRVGIPKEYFLPGMDKNIEAAVRAAVAVLEKGGAQVEEISLPHTPYALATYYVLMPAEASSNLGRFDGVRYGYSSSGENLIASYGRTRGEGFGDEAKRRIMLGTFALSSGYYDQYYSQALKARTLIKQDFDDAFKRVDLIVSPTSPTLAWKIGEKFNDPLTMYLSDIYTISANLATIPGLSLPCGFQDGLPIGLQLLAKPFNEQALLRAGMYYQSVTDWHRRTPEG